MNSPAITDRDIAAKLLECEESLRVLLLRAVKGAETGQVGVTISVKDGVPRFVTEVERFQVTGA